MPMAVSAAAARGPRAAGGRICRQMHQLEPPGQGDTSSIARATGPRGWCFGEVREPDPATLNLNDERSRRSVAIAEPLPAEEAPDRRLVEVVQDHAVDHDAQELAGDARAADDVDDADDDAEDGHGDTERPGPWLERPEPIGSGDQ